MQRLGLITLRRHSTNAPHLAWRGEPTGFYRVAAGALDLRRGPQSPALVASGKASPHGVARGPLGIPLPWMPGPKTLCGVGAGTGGFLSSADMRLGVLLESHEGSQNSSRVGACTYAFLPSCSSSVMLPFAWIKGSVTFPRGFHTRLSHEAFPQGCPTCHLGVSRSSA